MQDFLLRILVDTAALTIAGAILLFAGRKILAGTIEHYFTRLADSSKASVELEKQKESFLLSTRNSVYPEIVELVYRLRNTFRDGLLELKEPASNNAEDWWPHSFDFGEPLYVLTEQLYKYRAFVPEEVFDSLHRFKRCLQDATVILNRLGRPVEREGQMREDFGQRDREVFRQRYAESIGELEALYEKVDKLYPQITEAVKSHMESVLSRKT